MKSTLIQIADDIGVFVFAISGGLAYVVAFAFRGAVLTRSGPDASGKE